MHKILSNKLTIFLLVFPGLLLFIFALFVPIFLSIYYGMTDYSGMGKFNYVGFENFINIFTNDPVFWQSVRNAILLGIGFVILQHPLCIIFAILLDRIGNKIEKVYRTMFFIPCVISTVVTTKMWVNILDPNVGMLNKILDSIGLGFLKQEWLGNPKTALLSVLFICIWQGFGWGMLIYYSGLKGISEELYEAAKIDGATSMQVYMRITLPMLKPVIRINVTLAMIAALKQMETVYLATNGGPGDATQFLANYLYIRAFSRFEYGYANAIAVIFVIICLLATIISNKILASDKEGY
jgi:raffinose/stachyose/melibiose transport system permease protein